MLYQFGHVSDSRSMGRSPDPNFPASTASVLHHGHWPLLTQPGAAVAFKVGDASASVDAGAEAVAVGPRLMAVGLTDMAGTTGDVYCADVGESPEPPATA
jgi:hypothetical protein